MSTAGSGNSTHWNQPASSSRLSFMRFSTHFDGHDDGGVGAAEKFGEQHAGLAEALVVTLQAGEDQIEIFGLDRGGERARGARADRA